MIDIAVQIYSIAKQIYDAAELAKANQDQSKVLAKRVSIISEQVKSLKGQPAKYERALKELLALLQECLEFILKFQKKSFLSKMFFGGSQQQEFADYNDRLQRLSMDLSLGIQVQLLFNHDEDKRAEAKDSEQLQAIARQNQEQLKLAKQADAKHDEVLRRLELLAIAAKTPQKPDVLHQLQKRYQMNLGEVRYGVAFGSDDYSTWYQGTYLAQPVFIKRINAVSDEVHHHVTREVAVLSCLHSPYILSLYGACLESTHSCLIMESVTECLITALKKSCTVSQQLEYLKNIAAALHYLHSKRVVHGNLSVNSIMLTEDGKAKVTGFGFSATEASTVKALGQSHLTIGSAWVAPERFKLAHREPTQASDIYSLGLVCFALMTQQLPFHGISEGDMSAKKTPSFHESMLSSLPSWIRSLVAECWHVNPIERPSAIDIMLRLAEIEKGLIAPVENPETRYQAGLKAESEKNLDLARTHYQAAVALGHVKAKTNLAKFFEKGWGGLPKDEKQSFALLSQASEGGHNRAMFNLGLCHQFGKGTVIDSAKAKHWYEKALSLGYKDAEPYLKSLNASFAGNLKTFS